MRALDVEDEEPRGWSRHKGLAEALLALERGRRDAGVSEPFSLAELVREVLDGRREEADALEVTLLSALAPATAVGRVRLVERLVVVLVENAIRHNAAGGWAGVTVRTDGERAVLTVVNTGPSPGPIEPPSQNAVLVTGPPGQDAVSLTGRWVRGGVGGSAGLSIVRAVADAHGATIAVTARPEGGLVIGVAFPAAGAG